MAKRAQDVESSSSRKRIKEAAPKSSAAVEKRSSREAAPAADAPIEKSSSMPGHPHIQRDPTREAHDAGQPPKPSSPASETTASTGCSSKASPENPATESGALCSTKGTTAGEAPPPPLSPGPSTPDHWPASTRASPVPGVNSHASVGGLRASFKGIDYVPDDVLHRLHAFTNKKDTKKHRYSLATIPPTVKWGTSSRTEKFLCIDNEPITIWALANVGSTWFQDPDGNPHGRVNVGFELPFRGDDDCADNLYLKANPPITDKDDVKFSGRYMKRFEKGRTSATIVPFEAIYDATKRFKPKSEMPTLTPADVGKRDIVLVESNFIRWKEGDAKKIRKWTEWRAGLDLLAVSLLFEAPAGIVLEREIPTVDDEDDDM